MLTSVVCVNSSTKSSRLSFKKKGRKGGKKKKVYDQREICDLAFSLSPVTFPIPSLRQIALPVEDAGVEIKRHHDYQDGLCRRGDDPQQEPWQEERGHSGDCKPT